MTVASGSAASDELRRQFDLNDLWLTVERPSNRKVPPAAQACNSWMGRSTSREWSVCHVMSCHVVTWHPLMCQIAPVYSVCLVLSAATSISSHVYSSISFLCLRLPTVPVVSPIMMYLSGVSTDPSTWPKYVKFLFENGEKNLRFISVADYFVFYWVWEILRLFW